MPLTPSNPTIAATKYAPKKGATETHPSRNCPIRRDVRDAWFIPKETDAVLMTILKEVESYGARGSGLQLTSPGSRNSSCIPNPTHQLPHRRPLPVHQQTHAIDPRGKPD